MEPDPTPPSASPEQQRTIRTYAQREDAERAREMLADHGIAASIQEFAIKDPAGSGRTIPRGCSLQVPVADAAEAARQLMRMAPSEPAGKERLNPEPPTRLRRRASVSRPQTSTLWLVGIAIVCSAAAMFYLVHGFLNMSRNRAPVEPEGTEHYVVSEDLNWDGEPDTEREYSPAGALLQIREDRNFDGVFEFRWIWQRGILTYRDRDIDGDGHMDERTTYDGYDQPFYVDLRPNAKGTVINRRVYREGVLWKILDDMDADTHFDRIREYDNDGRLFRDDPLPLDSPENDTPKPEPLPAPAQ